MEQLLVHLFGDFFLQNDWMALNKSKSWKPCLVHVIIYTACFLILTMSWKALLVIGGTHFFIDRFHTPLKRLIWLKSHLNPTMKYPDWEMCNTTGYFDTSPINIKKIDQIDIKKWGEPRPFFITIWLYIVCDNLLHLTINYFALKYLA